jgi:hypothetical protein
MDHEVSVDCVTEPDPTIFSSRIRMQTLFLYTFLYYTYFFASYAFRSKFLVLVVGKKIRDPE